MRYLSLIIFFGLVAVVLHSCHTSTPNQPPEQPLQADAPEVIRDTIVFDSSAVAHSMLANGVPIPRRLTFAGEEVPLERADIRERLELELLSNAYRHSRTLLILKRAGRWKDTLQSLLRSQDVPEDFFYLAIAESELQADIKSPAGASGMWQFMKGTGKEYDLKIDSYVDQRRDPFLSALSACDYLKKGKQKFPTWTLVAASYNMGQSGLKKKMKDQRQEDYYNLHLYRETSRYVFRIMAFKVILENPELYGFSLQEKQLYKPWEFEVDTVTSTISHLADYAVEKGTSYYRLRQLNPWFNNTSNYRLPASEKKPMILRLPKDRVKNESPKE